MEAQLSIAVELDRQPICPGDVRHGLAPFYQIIEVFYFFREFCSELTREVRRINGVRQHLRYGVDCVWT